MNKKYFFILCVLSLIFLIFSPLTAIDALSVGVKVGDWIEYKVSTTGNPPEVHNVQFARMEIVSVQGPEIKANVTTQDNSGVFSSLIMDMNLEKGQVGAWFLIPSNLNVGDSFYDINLGRNITIEGQEQKNYAGAVRTVINATTSERIKDWDKVTGVFVKSIDTLPGYTINATAIRTNMWKPQILGNDQTVFYEIAVLVVAVITIVIAVVFIVRKRQ
ncbi:MAG TPA: hypothetical protein VF350_02065 [Candidatus Bathyarchaeia archaeon]